MNNKERIRGLFDELSKGDPRPLLAAMSDDVAWTVMGQTQWSRTYQGKAAVVNDLLGVLRARLAGGYRATAQRIIAEDPYVVVQARGESVTKSGKPYNNEYCFVYRIENGVIVEVTEYMDTELVTSALSE